LGVRDGVLYREWLPDDAVHTPTVEEVVSYIERRASVFREPDDRSLELAGSQPVWEVASEQIAKVYGRYWSIARMIFVDRLVRVLLKADHLAVSDGSMQMHRWFTVDGQVRKIDVSARMFGNLDLMTYDPAYDAVAFSVDHGQDAEEMRREYSQRVESLSNEKWLLYELVRLWDDRRLAVINRREAANGRATAVRRYLSNALLHDVRPNTNGRVVALDVDGVVESEVFGFKAPSPSSVLAIRALVQHGYRPVVVTGRCVDDVRELVHFLKLSGGVAEYGSALVLEDGSVQSIIDVGQQAEVDGLRESLRGFDDVRIDERYTHIVRASSVDRDGRLRGLTTEVSSAVAFDEVHGDLQTDFVSRGVNKGKGVMRLIDALGADRVALAVGDTDADVALFEVAEKSAVPSHATAKAKAAADIKARSPYQVGLAEIVGKLIGHRIGGCAVCATGEMDRQTKAMVALLQTTEGAKRAVPMRTVRAIFAARRSGATS
jgi:hydroxymethylpyrimidine pyrophosphatase-like HAD family hydrolase